MEFEELKKVWDKQNEKPIYVMNEEALHRRILSKKKGASHITSFTELMLILVNAGAGALVLIVTLSKPANIFMSVLAGWMFVTAGYALTHRLRRLRDTNVFDRSMLGDLQHALSDATYQVRLSGIMRWNILPLGALTVLGVLQSSGSWWFAVGLVVFLALAHFAGGWEHRIYERRKVELERLREMVERADEPNDVNA